MPTKNVTGMDSVESTLKMMSARFASQLQEAGAQVAPDALVDLHPACCGHADELAERGIGPGWRLEQGSRLYLCARSGPASGAFPMAEGLVLEQGASLVIDARRPYGGISLGERRSVQVDPALASRLSVGRGLRIASGIRAVFRLGPGASLTIPAGRVISEDVHLELGRGDEEEL